jgi:ATP-dependent Clp protease ATP-binding subunit ClpA
MSEFTEPHSVAKLIGAPPGYVGYEKEGLLISALRTHPHCVVLFDEIEKAHPQVYDLFLQIFDEGRLTGAHGKSADFTQAIVILTSNIDTAPATGRPLGFIAPAGAPEGTPGPDPRIALASHFRPELINRIDDVIVFRPLGKEQLRRIIDRYVREIGELLKARHFDLNLDEAVYDRLIELGAGDRFGARELRRVVDRHLRQPLAREVLTRTADGGTITVSVDGDEFRFV